MSAPGLDEVQIAGQLEHPNIPPIYDMGSVDSEPFFTWEKPEKEYKPYINSYEKTLKGTLTQFPCFFTRPSPSSLSIELNPEGTVTYFLGDKQIEEDNLTVEEKEAVLDELECIFYDEMVKTKIGDEYDL